MESKLVSINILTYNSEKYIENCLNSVLTQTYPNVEVLVIDNNSSDDTVAKIQNLKFKIQNFRFIENSINLGYTGGNNTGIKQSRGEYVVLLNPDVVLDKDFIKEINKSFEKNPKIGAIQAKIYQLNNHKKTKIIDTVGSIIFKTGEVNDQGQGEKDKGQYNSLKEVFSVNGVAPAYRRTALNDVKLKHEYFDENFFSYVEDVDLGWRLRWKAWKTGFNPNAIIWHDRTSAKIATGDWSVFRKIRKSQSFWIRKMGWRNQWLLFIKNQSFSNALKFLYWFTLRQTKLFLYLLFFEPKVILSSIPEIILLLPKMLKKRRIIMKNRRVSNKEMGKWFR